MSEATEGYPTQGSQTILVGRGVVGFGLAFGGTHKKSGASILTTSAQKVTFDHNAFYAGNDRKIPREIRFKADGAALTLHLGDVASEEGHDDGSWTDWLPCTDLWMNQTAWYVTGGATADLEYEIIYT